MAKVDYEELSKELDRLLDLFESKRLSYAVSGGFAASFHGRQRLTEDIDLAVRPTESQALINARKAEGYAQYSCWERARSKSHGSSALFLAAKRSLLTSWFLDPPS